MHARLPRPLVSLAVLAVATACGGDDPSRTPPGTGTGTGTGTGDSTTRGDAADAAEAADGNESTTTTTGPGTSSSGPGTAGTDGSGSTSSSSSGADTGDDTTGDDTTGDEGGSTTGPAMECGNNMVEGSEQCDDGDMNNADGCEADCTITNGAVAIDAASAHTCALVWDGEVRCWGSNSSGQLGYGNTTQIGDTETPASAGSLMLGMPALQIATAGSRSCALLEDGTVKCWGLGTNGQLGNGSDTSVGGSETPDTLTAVDVGAVVAELAAGNTHTCARTMTGGVRCWGAGTDGVLGYGDENNVGGDMDPTPATAGDVDLGMGVTATHLAAGMRHTCAIVTGGAVHCWGNGANGRLGMGNEDDIGDTETPGSVGPVVLPSAAVAIAAGGSHTCAALDTGALHCWGRGSDGQLGYGNNADVGDAGDPVAAVDLGMGATVIDVGAGFSHTCTLLDSGEVFCWGTNNNGQLGYGNTTVVGTSNTPVDVGAVPLGGAATAIDLGRFHTCAIMDTAGVRCWGNGANGRLGYAAIDSLGNAPATTPDQNGDITLFE